MFGVVYHHTDISKSIEEILNNRTLFGIHAPYTHLPILRECKTFYYSGNILNKQLAISRDPHVIPSAVEALPNTWGLIQKSISIISNPIKQIGRAYITILDPGMKAYKHVDTDKSGYFQIVDRYQLYLATNEKVDMDELNKGFCSRPGDLVEFNSDSPHYFHNDGDTPFIVVVFDVFR